MHVLEWATLSFAVQDQILRSRSFTSQSGVGLLAYDVFRGPTATAFPPALFVSPCQVSSSSSGLVHSHHTPSCDILPLKSKPRNPGLEPPELLPRAESLRLLYHKSLPTVQLFFSSLLSIPPPSAFLSSATPCHLAPPTMLRPPQAAVTSPTGLAVSRRARPSPCGSSPGSLSTAMPTASLMPCACRAPILSRA